MLYTQQHTNKPTGIYKDLDMKHNMKNEQGFTLAELLIVLWGVVVLALLGGAVWVAFHFVAKFW